MKLWNDFIWWTKRLSKQSMIWLFIVIPLLTIFGNIIKYGINQSDMEKKIVVECMRKNNFTDACKLLISSKFQFSLKEFEMLKENTAD